jgi:hypothetical protein
MINKRKIQEIHEQKPVRGLFETINELPKTSGDYSIEKHPRMNFLVLRNSVANLGTDQPVYITGHIPEILDVEFDSILIVGLGLGVIPYVVQDFCSVVDVVELQPDVISCVNQLGHLNSKVNLIQGEISTYTPARNYDVILLDIWYTEITEELTDQLIEKYSPHLNAGGFLYIPINAGSIEDKVKIYNNN